MRRLVPRSVDGAEVEAAYLDLAAQHLEGRPYVAVNMVASADGAISVAGRTQAMSSEADRFVFHHLRSLVDVILVGARTVRAEHYGPPRVNDERQAARVARGQAPVPRIAIVSSSLDLDWSSRLFRESPTRPFILTTSDADVTKARQVADVVVAGEGRVDLARALGALFEHGVEVILGEGGPTLNGLLASADLIDELCLTIAPAMVGGDAGAGLLGRARLPDLRPMTLVHAFEEAGDLFLRYRRDRGTGALANDDVRRVSSASEEAARDSVEAFHGVMADIDFPMVIVTAADGEERSGCLVGFHAQSSIDPPRFTVWISKKNHTYAVARRAEVLTVHLPSAEQRDLAALFGEETGDEVDKFAACGWRVGPHGAVVLEAMARWFVGRVTETLDTGDHVAFLLEPIAGEVGEWSGQLGFQAVKDLTPGHEA